MTLYAALVGTLAAAGAFMLLQQQIARLVLGLSLLTTATNLLVFATGGIVRGRASLVPPGADVPARPYADPIPQALVLTAIVIGFGLLVFTIVLAYRAYESTGTDDLTALRGGADDEERA